MEGCYNLFGYSFIFQPARACGGSIQLAVYGYEGFAGWLVL